MSASPAAAWDVIGSGTDALLLPAPSSVATRDEMQPLAALLAADRRCVIPDWPGFGDAPRGRPAITAAALDAFLDGVVTRAIGAPALGIAAGHACGYLAMAARRHPGVFDRLVLVAPTWRGPFPTMLGPDRLAWLGRIRRAIELPVVGELLYRATTSRRMVERMMRAHVYADPQLVTPALLAAKRQVTRQKQARFGTAAFITGGLDPVGSREAFLALFGPGLPPVLMLRPDDAPSKSAAEMDALAAAGLVATGRVPGALAAHEEYAGEVAAAIRRFTDPAPA